MNIKNKRLYGVDIFGSFLILGGFVLIFNASLGLVMFEGRLSLPARVILFASGVFFLITAIGIFKFKEWARKTLILLSIFCSVVSTLKILILMIFKDGDFISLLLFGVMMLVYALPAFYFTRSKVKEQFK